MSAPESFYPMHAKMSASEREASKQIQAIMQIQTVLQSANRLLWPDAFQMELVQAARLLHFDLRPKLQRKATVDIAERFEYYTDILVRILACWHQRNRLLTIKLGLTLDDIPITARIGQDERREIFETKAKTLPTSEGCEVNLLTAQELQRYFADFTALKMTAKDRGPSSQAEKRISVCLASIRDRVNNVTISAEQLRNDCSAPRSHLSRFQASDASSAESATVVESKGDLTKRRSSQTLRKAKGVFSRTNLKSGGEDLSRKSSSSNLRDTLKRTREVKPQIWQQLLGTNYRRPSSATVRSSLLPSLSALPPAPLGELEKKQLDIRISFLRASDDGERGDSRMELNGVLQERRYHSHHHATSPKPPRTPRTQQMQTIVDSVTGVDIEDYAAFETQAWQKQGDNHTCTPQPKPTSHAHRCHTVDHSDVFSSSSGVNLPALERNILDDCCTTAPPPKPSHIADPETEKAWWRDQAFEALEGRSSRVDGQTAKGEQEEGDDGSEGEEFTAEQLNARRTEARALALAVLDGTGPYDAGSSEFSGDGRLVRGSTLGCHDEEGMWSESFRR